MRALPARALTLSRVIGLPVFLWLLVRVSGGGPGAPALVAAYVVLALSDYVDGPVARRLGTASPRWGAVDVAADILFNVASLSVAAALGWVGPWVPAGVAVLAGRFLWRASRRAEKALAEDRAGKLAGVAFYLLVGVVVLGAVGAVPAGVVARAGDVVFVYTTYAFWTGRIRK